ncbi:matrixin family metalloprotease [Geodermatophilus sp. SYSU D00710]
MHGRGHGRGLLRAARRPGPTAVAVGCLVLALTAWSVQDPAGAPPETAPAAVPGQRPTPGVGAAPSPLGVPPPAPAPGGSWAFLDHQADGVTPVAYDPCRAVHYVVGAGDTPPDAEALVADAVAEVAAATGLRFVPEGRTDERVGRDRPAYQPARYGNRWAPVLVSFEPPAGNPDVGGGVAARGGSEAVSAGGPAVYVTGSVVVDADWAAGAAATPAGRAALRAVLVHELAHVLGLAHVDDPGELMHGANDGQLDLGPGDRAGLARLGRGACEPAL